MNDWDNPELIMMGMIVGFLLVLFSVIILGVLGYVG